MSDPAPVRRRRPLWALGAVLWLGVLVAGAAVFFLRGDRGTAANGDAPLKVVRQGEGGAELAPAGYEKPATIEFDPAGLPEFALTERRGGTVTKKDLLGKVSVVGFIFTRCAMTCPRVSKSMMEQRKLVKDAGVQFVSLSVDPAYDTPEILTKYSDYYAAKDDAGWLWLTGDRAEVYDLIRGGFQQSVAENDGAVDPGFKIFHTNNLMLVGPDGVVRGKYNALAETDMAALRRDAMELTKETADGGEE